MIIQDPKSKEFKDYEPHELPDGCIVSYFDYFMNCRIPLALHGVDSDYRLMIREGEFTDIVLHDIVNDKGESTHNRRYMATDKNDTTWIYVSPPKKVSYVDSYGSRDCFGPECHGKNICGQTWSDEPWEVWECIQ